MVKRQGFGLLRPVIFISLVSWGSGALAEPVVLVGSDLKAAVAGSVVEIDTPLGTKLPMRFGSDGFVSGEAGDLTPYLGSAKDRGRWWVDGDKLCSKFFRWFDAKVGCITLKQDGSRLYWTKEDGETGTATLLEHATVAPPGASGQAAAVVAQSAPEAYRVAAVAPSAVKAASAEQATATPGQAATGAVTDAGGADVGVAQGKAGDASPRDAGDSGSSPATMAGALPALDSVTVPMMGVGKGGFREASLRIPPFQDAQQVPAATASKPPGDGQEARPASHLPRSKTAAAPKVAALSQAAAPHKGPAKTPAATAKKGGLTAASSAALSTGSVPSVPSDRLRAYRVRGVEDDDVLNVRRGPSDEHESIAAIPSSGRSVEITGLCQDTWCPIRYGKIKGWVNSLYLAEETQQIGSAGQVYVAKP